MDGNPCEVNLLAEIVNGKRVYEAVPAVDLENRKFRLTASPGFAPGVASGDEIEMVPEEWLGYRVLRRSGNICVQLFLHPCEETERWKIIKMVESTGGWLDGGKDGAAGHLLIFTFPFSTGFGRIEEVMDEIQMKSKTDRWVYGNIYSLEDGKTPLNWWLQM